jgi:hypothetical protein
MPEKTKLVRIKLESWNTLQKLSRLSDRDMNSLVEEWLTSLGEVLASYEGDFSRISIMSWRHEKSNDCVTRLAPIFCGQIPLRDLTKIPCDKIEEVNEDQVLKRELAKKMKVKA